MTDYLILVPNYKTVKPGVQDSKFPLLSILKFFILIALLMKFTFLR